MSAFYSQENSCKHLYVSENYYCNENSKKNIIFLLDNDKKGLRLCASKKAYKNSYSDLVKKGKCEKNLPDPSLEYDDASKYKHIKLYFGLQMFTL